MVTEYTIASTSHFLDPVRKRLDPELLQDRNLELRATLDELAAELETNGFPALPDYTMSAAADDGASTLTVTVDSEHFVAGRAAILRYFDESLFSFERGGTE